MDNIENKNYRHRSLNYNINLGNCQMARPWQYSVKGSFPYLDNNNYDNESIFWQTDSVTFYYFCTMYYLFD